MRAPQADLTRTLPLGVVLLIDVAVDIAPPSCRFSLLRLQAVKNKHFPGIRVVGCFRTDFAQHCSLDSRGSHGPKELREDSTQTKNRVATNTRD